MADQFAEIQECGDGALGSGTAYSAAALGLMALFFPTTSEGMMIKFTSLQQMMMPFYSFNSWMLWVGLETFAITG